MLPPLKRHADRLRRAAVLGILAGGAATPALAGPPPCPPAPSPCPPVYNPCPPGVAQPGVITPVTPAPPAPMDGSATDLLPETFSPAAPPSPAGQNFAANTANPLAGRSGLAAVGGGVGDPGYIDPAVVASRFRLRYSGARDGNSDRGEFLYGAYDLPALLPGAVSPAGPVRPIIDRFDYDEIAAYLELEMVEGVSAFVEVPYRDVSGYDQFRNQNFGDSGLGDINAGVRVSLYDDCDSALTFQLMYQTNTGDPDFGVGNGVQFIVPGLLFQESLTDDLHLFGEAQYYVDSGNGTTYTGALADGTVVVNEEYTSDVLRFGLGTALDLVETCDTNLQLLNEFVGWTFDDGLQKFEPGTDTIAIVSADGETIVNYKVGLRYLWNRQSVYVGYGTALTDDVLYDDIVRLEYSVLLD